MHIETLRSCTVPMCGIVAIQRAKRAELAVIFVLCLLGRVIGVDEERRLRICVDYGFANLVQFSFACWVSRFFIQAES